MLLWDAVCVLISQFFKLTLKGQYTCITYPSKAIEIDCIIKTNHKLSINICIINNDMQ